MGILEQLERFKQYYKAGYSQKDAAIKCFAKNEKDRKAKISKALTYIHSLGLLLKVEASDQDTSFLVKPLFH